MRREPNDHSAIAFEQAEGRLFASTGVQVTGRRVSLADPAVSVRVLEVGDGPPLVLIHGSGMSASPDARLEVIPGRHTPFLDDPARCGALIDELIRAAARSGPAALRPGPGPP